MITYMFGDTYMDLHKRFCIVEKAYQSYQSKPDLKNLLRLEDELGEMGEEVGELIEEEEARGE